MATQRQTAVSAYLESKQLLLFVFAGEWAYGNTKANSSTCLLDK